MPSLLHLRLLYGAVAAACAAALWAFDPGAPGPVVLGIAMGFCAANALNTSHTIRKQRRRYARAARTAKAFWRRHVTRRW